MKLGADISFIRGYAENKNHDTVLIGLCPFVNFQCGNGNCFITLLHSERPKLYGVLAFLSAIGLT